MGKGVWGLDISKYSIKAVRTENTPGGMIVTRSDVTRLELEGAAEAAALDEEIRLTLEEMKSRLKIGRERVVLSLPGHSTFNRLIKLPPVDDEKIPEVVRYEAQSQIPFNIDEVIWDYQYVDRPYAPGEEKEVILFAIKRDIVEQFLANLEPVGLNIDAIQFAPIALYNFLVFDQDVSTGTVVLDMGGENTDLLIIDGAKFWIRNLPITGNDITKALQKAFNIPFAEAEKLKLKAAQSQQAQKIFNAIQPVLRDLVGEMHRSTGYYKASISKSIRFDKVILLGNSTKTVNFQKFVSQSLQMPAARINALRKIQVAGGIDAASFADSVGSLGTAIGLAIQGQEEARNEINLLPGSYRRKKELKKKQPFIVGIFAVLYAIVLLMGFSARSQGKALEEANRKGEDANKLYREQSQRYLEATKVEDVEKPLESLTSISYERDLILKVINEIVPNIPDNGNRNLDNAEKLWILDWRFKEAPGPELPKEPPKEGEATPVPPAPPIPMGTPGRTYLTNRKLVVTIDGAIVHGGRSPTDIDLFVAQKLLGIGTDGRRHRQAKGCVVETFQLKKADRDLGWVVTSKEPIAGLRPERLPESDMRTDEPDNSAQKPYYRFSIQLDIPMRPEVRQALAKLREAPAAPKNP